MDLYNASAFTRRQFLHSGLTLASAAATIPWFLNSSALGMPRPLPGTTSMPGIPEDHVLVVIQLSGGNDGLNTVIPYGMDAYYKARPGIGIQAGQALKLKEVDGIGLHAGPASSDGATAVSMVLSTRVMRGHRPVPLLSHAFPRTPFPR